MKESFGITHYIIADDERYPVLVLQGDFGSVGYSINKDTGELSRICVCHAREDSECVCGYDNIEVDDVY